MPLSACAERSFDLSLPALARRRGGLFSSCLHSLKGKGDFSLLACTRSKARRTFLFCSRLHSLKGEEGFFCSRLHSLKGKEGFFCCCLHSLKGEEDFFCSRLHSLKGEEDFFCSRLHSLKGEEDFSAASSRTRALRSLIIICASDRRKTMRFFKLSTINYCCRSSKDDGDFKTFN